MDTSTNTPTTPRVSWLALAAALVGAGLMAWGFVAGIDAALDGSGSGPGVFVALFMFGAALVVVAAVVAIIQIARRRALVLGIVTLGIAALPALAVIVLVVRARG